MRAWAKGKMYDENVKDMHKRHVFVKFTIFMYPRNIIRIYLCIGSGLIL
jgi:hypothetical protein